MSIDHRRSRTFVTLALALAAATVTACGGGEPVPPEGLPPAGGEVPRGGTFHVDSAPANTALSYWGGRVNGGAQVVQVLWGKTGIFDGGVAGTGVPSIASFYTDILSHDAYAGWLDSEYNTFAPTGTKTNQRIGTGAFVGQYAITPSITTTTVDDTQIQSELSAQISAGHLPPPAYDAAGNPVTYYAVFFPEGMTITVGEQSSCQSFCQYHGAVAAAGSLGEFYYGVQPDLYDCLGGCAGEITAASHALAGMMTDPEGALSTSFAPPVGWYDPQYGEISDICNGQQGSYVGCDGQTYTVALAYSKIANDCVPPPSCKGALLDPDFESGTFGGWAASGTTSLVSSGCYSGSFCAELGANVATNGDSTITQAFTAPDGALYLSFAYEVFCDDSVTYDWATATLTDTTDNVTTTLLPKTCSYGAGWKQVAQALAGGHSYVLTLTNHDDGYQGDPTYTLFDDLVIITGGLLDGGFESGAVPWATSDAASIIHSGCHSGASCAQAGEATHTNGDSAFSQTFSVGPGSPTLRFWYKVTCNNLPNEGWATATLTDHTTNQTTTVLPHTCVPTGSWTQVSAPLTGDHWYTLELVNHDYAFGNPTFTLFDDVSVE